MRLISFMLDMLFPPSAHAALVAQMHTEDVRALYNPARAYTALSLASYHDPRMRALIHEAKFSGNARAIELLATLLTHFLNELPARERYHIVPIPLASQRLRERGYNQSERIARAAHAAGGICALETSLLIKQRDTAPQTSLSKEQRASNLVDAFAVHTHTLPATTPLLLFDDVVTTGATFAEASRAFREAGFSHITAVALAH